ncbi:MAG: hypothetical protein WCD76_02940, partial [Pyrinomonadaceae bacterium]
MQTKDNPLILSVDSATGKRSAALMRGLLLLAQVATDRSQQPSVNILRDIEGLFVEASLQIGDVDLFAVTTGPGSFTGVRAGLATMKGMAVT